MKIATNNVKNKYNLNVLVFLKITDLMYSMFRFCKKKKKKNAVKARVGEMLHWEKHSLYKKTHKQYARWTPPSHLQYRFNDSKEKPRLSPPEVVSATEATHRVEEDQGIKAEGQIFMKRGGNAARERRESAASSRRELCFPVAPRERWRQGSSDVRSEGNELFTVSW